MPDQNVEQRSVTLRIWRQESPDHEGRFEVFRVPFYKGANVISCLMEIQRNPLNAEGAVTTPVVWDSNCLEEVCGSCTMNINGRVRMACSSLVEKLQEPIVLEPLRKFRLVRDLTVDRRRMFSRSEERRVFRSINGGVLMGCSSLVEKLQEPIVLEPLRKFRLVRDLTVDRSRMFSALKQVRAWIELDGTYNLGPGPRQSQKDQATMYVLSTCMTCACCLEACPQVQMDNSFIGAAAISQARLFNMNPTG